MLEWMKVVLEQSPLLALFAAVGLGYALGQVSIAGFSLWQYALRMSTDDLFGVLSGTAGNPAILAYANQAVKRLTPRDSS